MKVVIIGGVAGGATAAARLRRNDETAEILLIERGPYISFANCGLPYHISGTIAERSRLLVATEDLFRNRYRVEVKSQTEAVSIDRDAKTVLLRNLATGAEEAVRYDKLLLSPGAAPLRPPMGGIDSPRIFTLRNVPDLDKIMAQLNTRRARHAVVVGGGYIGIEMAENLAERGLATTIVEGAPQILAPFDEEMAAIVHAELKEKKIELYLGSMIDHFEDRERDTTVFLKNGKRLQADLVILAIGVRPETQLAKTAGLLLGERGGIKVNKYLQTSDPSIYSVGDAVEVMQTITGKPALIPLAGPANRQGRMAADNMTAASEAEMKPYKGTLGTAVLKVFDLAAACTGLNERQLDGAGIAHHATITHSGSHAGYYPGAMPIALKLIYGDDGTIFGAQAVSADGADKRIDVIATAIHAGLKVQDLADLELAYAPPFGAAKDPVNIAGYVATNVLNGSQRVISWQELRDILAEKPETIQLVDVRTPAEFSLASLPGAKNLEVDHLREHLSELDPEKPTVVFCQVGLRGYIAYRMLVQSGFKDVRNLTGGFKTWHWATEKQANPDIFDADMLKPLEDAPESEAAELPPKTAQGHIVNAIGLQCPGPIVQTYHAMEEIQPGEKLEIQASDPAFGRDVRAWARQMGHEVLSVDTKKGTVHAVLRKGAQKQAEGAAPVPGNKFTEVIFSGDLDKVMASLIIANGAQAMGKQVSLFFTFWGLNVLRREGPVPGHKTMIESAFGFMLPKGAGHLNSVSNLNFAGMGAAMMKKVMADKHVETPAQLLHQLIDNGAEIIACQMSMDVMGIRAEELIDGVEIGGVSTFLGEAEQSGTTLFI